MTVPLKGLPIFQKVSDLGPFRQKRRATCDIPDYKFERDADGFRIPLTQQEVGAYESTIAYKRQKLETFEREVTLQTLGKKAVPSGGKPRKPVSALSSQEIELMFAMIVHQTSQVAIPINPQKIDQLRKRIGFKPIGNDIPIKKRKLLTSISLQGKTRTNKTLQKAEQKLAHAYCETNGQSDCSATS